MPENTQKPKAADTKVTTQADIEDYFRNPPPGSAAERAIEFGIGLSLTLENLRLTPEERIRKLDRFIEDVAELKNSPRMIAPTDANADD